MSPNVYHLSGPLGVKYATQRIRRVLQENKPQFFLRVDIKSFYKSICHYKLIRDIKQYYDDPKVQHMLENIIKNPIETPRGYKNPGNGIALRGPLSQFFSALFLKKLDDAFMNCDVDYFRFQDDVLLLCKTKRQLNRCRRRMMEILHERGLTLSRKKSRTGSMSQSFHFFGIHYPGTRPQDYTKATPAVNDRMIAPRQIDGLILSEYGGKSSHDQAHLSVRIFPHARTLRKTRE